MPHYYPVVFPAGRSLAGDSLGFHAYSLRVDNCTNQWYLEESTVSYIPPYSLGMCLRLYGTGVAILLAQAPVGQPQLAPIPGEQVVGVYSDQLRTEVAGVPIRNFALVQTVSDFQQGAQPATPPVGTTRMWADGSGNLHILTPDGQDATIVDSSNISTYITTATLGGDLYGTVSNAHIGVRYPNSIAFYDSGSQLRNILDLNGNVVNFRNAGQYFQWVNTAATQGIMTLDNGGNLSLVTGSLIVNVGTVNLSASDINMSNGSYLRWSDTYVVRWNAAQIRIGGSGGLTTAGNVNIEGSSSLTFGINGYGWAGINGQAIVQTAGSVMAQGGSYYFDGGMAVRLYWDGHITTNQPLQSTAYFQGNIYYLSTSSGTYYMQMNGANVQFVSCSMVVSWGGFAFSGNPGINLQWDGTYIRPTHSLAFNTVGNQVVWPNGSYISGNSGYVQGSKRSLKGAIAAVDDGELLALVADPRAPVVTYEWLDQADAPRTIGFIADQLADVLPAYVERDGDGEPAGYHPQEMAAILWGAVRALEYRVTALEGSS